MKIQPIRAHWHCGGASRAGVKTFRLFCDHLAAFNCALILLNYVALHINMLTLFMRNVGLLSAVKKLAQPSPLETPQHMCAARSEYTKAKRILKHSVTGVAAITAACELTLRSPVDSDVHVVVGHGEASDEHFLLEKAAREQPAHSLASIAVPVVNV